MSCNTDVQLILLVIRGAIWSAPAMYTVTYAAVYSLGASGEIRRGHEFDLHMSAKCRGDPAEHREGMAVIVCVLKPGDDGLLAFDAISKFLLSQPTRSTKLKDSVCDVSVHSSLLDQDVPLGLVGEKIIQESNGVCLPCRL